MMFKKKYDINWLLLEDLLQNFDYRVGWVYFTDGVMHCRPNNESNKQKNKIFKQFFKKCGWKLIIND